MAATTNTYGAATPSVTITSQQTVNWTNLPKYYLDGTEVKEYALDHGFQYIENEKYGGDG